MPNSEGQTLTTPPKVWIHWWLTAMDSTVQLTGQNRFTRSFSGGYKMMNGSCVRKLERVRCRCQGCEVERSESMETCRRWVYRGWWKAMVNDSTNSMRSRAMSDVFIVLSTFLAHFWSKVIPIGYLQSDPRSYCLCMLAVTCPLVEYFASPIPNVRLIRAVHFLSRV